MSAGYMRRCARKKRFETKAEARAARAAIAANSVSTVHAYLCDQCLGYHVGRADSRFKTHSRNGKRASKKMRGRL